MRMHIQCPYANCGDHGDEPCWSLTHSHGLTRTYEGNIVGAEMWCNYCNQFFVLEDHMIVGPGNTHFAIKDKNGVRWDHGSVEEWVGGLPTVEIARLLIGEAVGLMRQEVPAERFLTDLSSQLRLVRHVRIGVKNAAGEPLAIPGTAPPRTDDRPAAPGWVPG